MLSEVPMGVVVMAPHRRLLERAVHPLHLAVFGAFFAPFGARAEGG
jgi:hypothetical protein